MKDLWTKIVGAVVGLMVCTVVGWGFKTQTDATAENTKATRELTAAFAAMQRTLQEHDEKLAGQMPRYWQRLWLREFAMKNPTLVVPQLSELEELLEYD